MADEDAIARILEFTSYYDVLGVVREEVDAAGLRKAYLRRSMQCHPDKSTDPRATEAFQRVAEAYDTLSDPGKRSAYDRATNGGVFEAEGSVPQDVSPEQAFAMFMEAMAEFARENGIETERQSTIFDTLATGLLFVDGLLSGGVEDAGASASRGASAAGPSGTRLQGLARTFVNVGSAVSTLSQIYAAQRERAEAAERVASARR